MRPRALTRPVVLSGTTLPVGTRIIEIHLCNERAPEAASRSGAATWATRLLVRYRRSCRTIARRMASEPELADVQAVGGVTTIFGGAGGHGGAGRLPEHLGFEVLPHLSGGGAVGLFFQRLYAWGLLAAYTPGSLEGRRLRELAFVEVWMTREAFLERFARDRRG